MNSVQGKLLYHRARQAGVNAIYYVNSDLPMPVAALWLCELREGLNATFNRLFTRGV